jgi:pimeloyl-ACP methyl ester carboxylesterase
MPSRVSVFRNSLNTVSYVAPRLAGRFAFRLFTEPLRRAQVRPKEQEVHAQAEVRTLDVNGVDVKTYRWGDGRRLVLLVHGFEARGSSYATFVRKLSENGFTVLTYDAPGHGDSGGKGATILDHRAVIERLHELHGPFEAVIAHSFGVVCSFFAARDTVKVGRLVAISGVSEFDSLPDAFCAQLALRPAIGQDLRRRTEKLFLPETDIWRRFSPVHRPEELTQPILVVHDEGDREVPVEHGRRIADTYGNQAKLIITTGLGHRRILVDESVVDSVLEFLTAVRGVNDHEQ